MRAPAWSMTSFYTPGMLAALFLASGCWRPDAYEPPPPPAEEQARPVGDAPDAPDAGETPEDDAPPEAEGEPTEGPASAEEATKGEEDEPPPFPAYTGRTVQAPVTIVDDWGKPLAVLTVPDVAVEVRGEEAVRVRVWCEACKPQVEGWIQAHLVVRADGSPTGGSK